MVVIKQWGLQRSGTNLTKWAIENNFEGVIVYSNEGGWKHAVPSNVEQFNDSYQRRPLPDNKAPNFHIITHRDPYHWFYSFKRYSIGNPPTLSNFPAYQENNEDNTRVIMKLWNDYTKEYLEWSKSDVNCISVKYDKLIFETEATLNQIKEKFDLTQKKPWYLFFLKKPPYRLPNQGVDPHTKRKNIDLGFFESKEYLNLLPEKEKIIIQEVVDEKIMKKWYQ